MQTRTINRKLREEGHPVTLYRGEGYQYFEYDTLDRQDRAKRFETYSVMCPRLSDMPGEYWVMLGGRLAKAIETGEFSPNWHE
jgi:hypothetical protein